jgi:hypothetical protein
VPSEFSMMIVPVQFRGLSSVTFFVITRVPEPVSSLLIVSVSVMYYVPELSVPPAAAAAASIFLLPT